MRFLSALLLAGCVTGGLAPPARLSAADPPRIKVLIIDGQNNQAWQQTTPVMKKLLEDTNRFTVDVATTAQEPPVPARPKNSTPDEIGKFKAALNKYADDYAAYLEAKLKFRPPVEQY